MLEFVPAFHSTGAFCCKKGLQLRRYTANGRSQVLKFLNWQIIRNTWAPSGSNLSSRKTTDSSSRKRCPIPRGSEFL